MCIARVAASGARIAALIVADFDGGTRSGRAWEGCAASAPGAHAIRAGRKLDAMFAGDVALSRERVRPAELHQPSELVNAPLALLARERGAEVASRLGGRRRV
jgi:hypothetical protein